jgi:hypothetical protein
MTGALLTACAGHRPVEHSSTPAGQVAVTYCELAREWPKYHGHTVRVSGILSPGLEQQELLDPSCPTGVLSCAVIWPTTGEPKVSGRIKELRRALAARKPAWVMVEGVFFGPVPLDVDPRSPDWLQKAVSRAPRTYGHLNSFSAAIKVLRVIDVVGPNEER